MNDFFTRFTDWFSEIMGKWEVFAFFVLTLIAWVILGVPLQFSDTWQLIANTPTTWIELFLGLAVLASANRIEKRNFELHVKMAQLMEHIKDLTEAQKVELDEIDAKLK